MKPKAAGNTRVLKHHNSRLVLSALKEAREATVRDLAAATGLSTPTVGTLVQELMTAGVALEGALVPSEGGRPSRNYQFHATRELVLVAFTREVDGQDTLHLRVADLYGRVVDAEEHPFLPTTLADFESFFDPLFARQPALAALGLGLPGIEYEGVITVLDYPGLVGAPVLEHFRRRYGVPVLFENDVNAAVVGRGRKPAAAGTEAYLYFPQKYAPGCGLRVDGRLLKGRRHFAGEVGWLPLGVPWGDPGLRGDAAAASKALALVVVALTAVVAPESVVLYGEFLTPSHLAAAEAQCRALLPQGMVPRLTLTQEFSPDVEDGLIGLTLDRLAFEKE